MAVRHEHGPAQCGGYGAVGRHPSGQDQPDAHHGGTIAYKTLLNAWKNGKVR